MLENARTHLLLGCRIDIPMLTEVEWATLSPHLTDTVERIKGFRLAEASAECDEQDRERRERER